MDATKAELRARIRARRRQRRPGEAERAITGGGLSEREALRMRWEGACLYFGLSPYDSSVLPALFVPTPTEPDVGAIMERSPRCLLPIVCNEDGGAFSQPAWGVHVSGEDDLAVVDARRPAQPRVPVAPEVWGDVSIVLVPALALDRGGARLGQGGGWYDRALGSLPEGVPVVGVAFDDEVLEPGLIPVEPHDRFIDGIICPGAFIPVDL